MTKKVFAFLFVAFLAFALSSLSSPAYAVDKYNCPDFKYQEDAQAVYEDTPGDPYGLDGNPGPQDDDGEACEDNPHRPAGTDTEKDTETDSLPVTGINTTVLTIGGATLLLSGGLFFLASRALRRRVNQ